MKLYGRHGGPAGALTGPATLERLPSEVWCGMYAPASKGVVWEWMWSGG